MCIWTLTKEAATCRATSARVVVQKESSDCAKTGNAGLFQKFEALCRDRQPAVFGGAPMPVTDFRGRWVFASSVRFGARRASIPSVMETLSSADLKTLRAVLLAERASLLGVYASKLDVLAHSDCVSAEDQAPLVQDQFVALYCRSQELEKLREIESALERLREGEFGVCQICEELIPRRRLLAIPWADHCSELDAVKGLLEGGHHVEDDCLVIVFL